jgi:hypothetical protein
MLLQGPFEKVVENGDNTNKIVNLYHNWMSCKQGKHKVYFWSQDQGITNMAD